MDWKHFTEKDAAAFDKRYDAYSDPQFKMPYSFLQEVLPEIRKRQLGVNELPENEAKAFASIPGVRVNLNTDGLNASLPWYANFPHRMINGSLYNIYLDRNDKDIRRNLVHEMRHYLARMGVSATDDKKATEALQNVYGFRGSDKLYNWLTRALAPWLTEEEMFTTNSEHQYRIYEKLWNRLGRKPTPKEYFESFKKKPKMQIFNERLDPVGYDSTIVPDYIKEIPENRQVTPEKYKDLERHADDFINAATNIADANAPQGTSVKKAQWKFFAKQAVSQADVRLISEDGTTFSLSPGKTISHVVSEWNKAHPGMKITAEQIVAANDNLIPEKYVAGRKYRMPAVPAGRNNPFNMRHYNQGWLGEETAGLNRGDFLSFRDLWHGVRAGSRNASNLMSRLKSPTLRNFVPVYSPKHENNVKKHMSTISKGSAIGADETIDPNNSEQWIRFLKGLAVAESGKDALKGLTDDQIREAVESGRTSK